LLDDSLPAGDEGSQAASGHSVPDDVPDPGGTRRDDAAMPARAGAEPPLEHDIGAGEGLTGTPADVPGEIPNPDETLAEATDPYEGAVPPGYDWPTHGGYLGCLLGLMAACVLGGFLGSLLVGFVSVSPLAAVVTSAPVRIALILGTFVATMLVLGRVGWRLGRRFYREYPIPARHSARAVTLAPDPDELPPHGAG
jgi:hypothetical protein